MVNKYKQYSKVDKNRADNKIHHVCGSKRRYKTEEAARFRWKNNDREVYKCKHCGFWHRSSMITIIKSVLKRNEQR